MSEEVCSEPTDQEGQDEMAQSIEDMALWVKSNPQLLKEVEAKLAKYEKMLSGYKSSKSNDPNKNSPNDIKERNERYLLLHETCSILRALVSDSTVLSGSVVRAEEFRFMNNPGKVFSRVFGDLNDIIDSLYYPREEITNLPLLSGLRIASDRIFEAGSGVLQNAGISLQWVLNDMASKLKGTMKD